MDDAYLRLIHSDRVGATTRQTLLSRLDRSSDERGSALLSPELFLVLEAVIERLIPQHATQPPVEISRVLERQQMAGAGDGWRFAEMPLDAVAFEAGLISLDQSSRAAYAKSFAALDRVAQEQLLQQVAQGRVHWPGLSSRHWFEELLSAAVEVYVSHPSTLASMGFSGIAFLPRWTTVGLNTQQGWEPTAR